MAYKTSLRLALLMAYFAKILKKQAWAMTWK